MRLTALVVTAILAAGPAAAQQAETSPPPATPSSSADDKKPELPVSLGRIREGLERPAPSGTMLKALDRQPDFRVEIREKQKLEELIASLDFKAGPTPAGGLYAFEQQRMLTPSVDNPLAQPYAAFNQGQLMTILVENLVGKYFAGKALSAISKAQRESAEEAARRQVAEAIAEYCAAKPNQGAGIELCAPAAAPASSSSR